MRLVLSLCMLLAVACATATPSRAAFEVWCRNELPLLLEDHGVPGAAVSLVLDSDLLATCSEGVTGSNTPFASNTPVPLGGISHAVLTTIILHMHTQSYVSLEDDIRELNLPLSFEKWPSSKEYPLHMFISQTAGAAPRHMRFSIGRAAMKWSRLHGTAVPRDVTYDGEFARSWWNTAVLASVVEKHFPGGTNAALTTLYGATGAKVKFGPPSGLPRFHHGSHRVARSYPEPEAAVGFYSDARSLGLLTATLASRSSSFYNSSAAHYLTDYDYAYRPQTVKDALARAGRHPASQFAPGSQAAFDVEYIDRVRMLTTQSHHPSTLARVALTSGLIGDVEGEGHTVGVAIVANSANTAFMSELEASLLRAWMPGELRPDLGTDPEFKPHLDFLEGTYVDSGVGSRGPLAAAAGVSTSRGMTKCTVSKDLGSAGSPAVCFEARGAHHTFVEAEPGVLRTPADSEVPLYLISTPPSSNPENLRVDSRSLWTPLPLWMSSSLRLLALVVLVIGNAVGLLMILHAHKGNLMRFTSLIKKNENLLEEGLELPKHFTLPTEGAKKLSAILIYSFIAQICLFLLMVFCLWLNTGVSEGVAENLVFPPSFSIRFARLFACLTVPTLLVSVVITCIVSIRYKERMRKNWSFGGVVCFITQVPAFVLYIIMYRVATFSDPITW